MGPGKTASWTAAGLRQDLDAVGRWESMSYVGFGTISNRNNANLYEKPAILVLNQEFYDQFRKDLVYSFAVSYRRQNEYESEPPFRAADPPIRQEFRLYGRFSHVSKFSAVKWVNTFRSEIRNFFPRHTGNDAEVLQFRLRLRSQVRWTIDDEGIHGLIGSAEILASVGKLEQTGWTDFDYREMRFCLYYSLNPKGLPVGFDFGYMNNLLGSEKPLYDVHYLAIDVTWNNPFGTPNKPTEHLH
jgi:hypothetical protein